MWSFFLWNHHLLVCHHHAKATPIHWCVLILNMTLFRYIFVTILSYTILLIDQKKTLSCWNWHRQVQGHMNNETLNLLNIGQLKNLKSTVSKEAYSQTLMCRTYGWLQVKAYPTYFFFMHHFWLCRTSNKSKYSNKSIKMFILRTILLVYFGVNFSTGINHTFLS